MMGKQGYADTMGDEESRTMGKVKSGIRGNMSVLRRNTRKKKKESRKTQMKKKKSCRVNPMI